MNTPSAADSILPNAARLDELIEAATADCYDENEQVNGFFTMIDDNLALPFKTQILGVEASVVTIVVDNDGAIKAVCERDGELQRIALTDLPLPSPLPAGTEWIAAYRRWVEGSWSDEEDDEDIDE